MHLRVFRLYAEWIENGMPLDVVTEGTAMKYIAEVFKLKLDIYRSVTSLFMKPACSSELTLGVSLWNRAASVGVEARS